MNRRGFLTALLGGAAALAADPDKLLWKPGKLISIPSRRDKLLYQIGVDGVIPDDLALSLDQFARTYLQPAINALADRIDKEALQQFSRPRFLRLPTPRWIDGMFEVGKFGPIPEARLIKVRDPIRNQTLMRLDTLVEI